MHPDTTKATLRTQFHGDSTGEEPTDQDVWIEGFDLTYELWPIFLGIH
jgi:hypothetical protein